MFFFKKYLSNGYSDPNPRPFIQVPVQDFAIRSKQHSQIFLIDGFWMFKNLRFLAESEKKVKNKLLVYFM